MGSYILLLVTHEPMVEFSRRDDSYHSYLKNSEVMIVIVDCFVIWMYMDSRHSVHGADWVRQAIVLSQPYCHTFRVAENKQQSKMLTFCWCGNLSHTYTIYLFIYLFIFLFIFAKYRA